MGLTVDDGRLQTNGENVDELEYVDVRFDGDPVATVNWDGDELEVLVFHPEMPEDSLQEFTFEIPTDEPSWEIK